MRRRQFTRPFASALTVAALSLLCAFAASAQEAPVVAKVEPPNWWARHSVATVRVLVRGENLAGARVTSPNRKITVSNVRVNERGDYLFFDAAIAKDARPAKFDFTVVTPKGRTNVPFEVLPPLAPRDPKSTVTNDDVVYLVMTDRFANGDASNDAGVDRANPRMWHGGDFRGIEARLPYLKELSVTALWLTPWYDNSDEITTCDKPWCPMTSYHGYGAVDLYGVENHAGTFADLKSLIDAAHKAGIKVVQDQVLNHIGVRHPWKNNPPLDDWLTPWVQTRFNNSALLSPYSTKSEIDNVVRGWFDFSLPDMNYDQPEVERYEIQNALWWIGATGVDGVRQDTIQYVPRRVIRNWSDAILRQYPNFYLVGEVFDRDSVHTAFFQGGKTGWDGVDTHLPSVFDFKLWQTSLDVFTGKAPVRALRDVLRVDGLYGDPSNLTTLQDNHDTDRFMSLPGATKEGAMLHAAFLLTARGIPQLYAGEEILMPGGFDPDNRRDFPGGFPGDKADKFMSSGRTPDEQKMFDWIRELVAIRKGSEALKRGRTTDLFYDDDAYVFLRSAGAASAMHALENACIAINRGKSPRTFVVKREDYGVDLLASPKCAALGGASIEAGATELKITVPAMSVGICGGFVRD